MTLRSWKRWIVSCWVLISLAAVAPVRATEGTEPARRLSPEGTENLVAFSRLLGYVRFFHPSDQAAAANWDLTAIAGVQRIESAADGPYEPHLAARRAFITDGRAISYAESYIGIVEGYRLGEIVGEATAGTNGTLNNISLPGGYTLRFTGMRVQKHDGSQHHGVGILPTVPVARTYDGVAAGRDELLEKAIEVVSQ